MDSACRLIRRDLELLAMALMIVFATSDVAAASSIGINYGRLGDNLPAPDQVVALLAANNITKARIFDCSSDVMNAFVNSKNNNNNTNNTNTAIQLSVSIPNEQLQTIASSATSAASWVSANLAPFAGRLVIPTISVGNEVLTNGPSYAPYLLPAMRNILSALQPYAALSNVTRVSTPHAFSVMEAASFPPSRGAFNSTLVPSLRPILDFLNASNGPFMINVYPFFSYAGDPSNVPLEYALFGNSGVTDSGTGPRYGNLFDAMVDTAVSALTKLGYPNMPVVVTETGWPSKGEEPGATTANAARYNQNLIQHVQSAAGTPLRPGVTPETYIFALFNENQKTGPTSERNFGLFQPNQAQVYTIRLS